LEDAQLEDGTDLRGADLSGARLYQTAFRDVRINGETIFGIEDVEKPGNSCRYEYDQNTGVSVNEDVPRLRAAVWTHRRLESLFEENAMDQRARNAHIRKEEAQRAYHAEQVEDDGWIDEVREPPDGWLRSLGEYAVLTANWHLHRHGESLRRLLGISGLLIFFCGIVYAGAGIGRNTPESTYRITPTDLTNPVAMLVDLLNGLYFSVITFSTIGYGDFYPASPLSRLLVGIESLAGALFIALFVFVIGRRVAR
jgi:Ion channel.